MMNLLIRKMEQKDLLPLSDLLADPSVMRFLEAPYSKEKTEEFLRSAGLCADPLVYAVEYDGGFIGYVIFHDYDETGIEIGWVLAPGYWGKGIASQLTRQLIEKAKASGRQAVIECTPDHEVTKHIAMKFGFRQVGSRGGLIEFRL